MRAADAAMGAGSTSSGAEMVRLRSLLNVGLEYAGGVLLAQINSQHPGPGAAAHAGAPPRDPRRCTLQEWFGPGTVLDKGHGSTNADGATAVCTGGGREHSWPWVNLQSGLPHAG